MKSKMYAVLWLFLVGGLSVECLQLNKGDLDSNDFSVFKDYNAPSEGQYFAKRDVDDVTGVTDNTIKKIQDPVSKSAGSVSLFVPKSLEAKIDRSGLTNIEMHPGELTLFILTNTDIERTWDGIPYREQYLWKNQNAPCYSFDLRIPHEKNNHENLPICLYRKEMTISTRNHKNHETNERVFGHVMGDLNSYVSGYLKNTTFYGEVKSTTKRYIIEDKAIIEELYGPRLLQNLHVVLTSVIVKDSINAVVSTDKSLQRFIHRHNKVTPFSKENVSTSTVSPYMVINVGLNAFLISGNPVVGFDEKGQTTFTIGDQLLSFGSGTDDTFILKSTGKEYRFRPNVPAVVMEGLNATTLDSPEGSISIAIKSNTFQYGCVFPSPAFLKVRPGGFICKVCIGMDTTFKNFYMASNATEEDSYDFLATILDRVAWIFRSADWNHDGIPDDVGIGYDESQYYSWDHEAKSPDVALDVHELNKMYHKLIKADFSHCCLGIIYSMLTFPGESSAITLNAGPERGLCSIRLNNTSPNVVLISAKSKNGTLSIQNSFGGMTADQLTFLTAQEVGKAFGASLDSPGDPQCDSHHNENGTLHHYLLWPNVFREMTTNDQILSQCTIDSIYKVVNSCQSSCFEITMEPFCGNGILEIGEECDCGSESQCSKQQCCSSRSQALPCQKTGDNCEIEISASSKIMVTFYSYTTLLLLFFIM